MIRTRIAPSPTGEFHIGGMRTLLYAYALAKKDLGQFVLRVEDTDKNREFAGTLERIKEVIQDYGFEWDEYYVQSERLDIYAEHVKKLLDANHAYRCFCTEERLTKMREDQQIKKLPLMYDKTCRQLSEQDVEEKMKASLPYVVRLRVPEKEEISFHDEVFGELRFDSSTVDDQVLLKTDGFPTYHLAVVVDDHLMSITHVVRGNEWLPSAPKHVLLYKYFGWDMPKHVHLPNLKEKASNKKMSKRTGDVHARIFLEKGYLPEALVNFLMLLGWNPGTEQELFTLSEFIQEFEISKVHKTDLVSFDREKLLWMNGMYIRNLSPEDLISRIKAWSEKYGVMLEGDSLKVLTLVQDRLKTFSEYNELVSYFYKTPQVDASLFDEFADKERSQEIVRTFAEKLAEVNKEAWNAQNLEELCTKILSEFNFKPKEAYMTLRVALTGGTVSPHIFDVLGALGKEESLSRIKLVTH